MLSIDGRISPDCLGQLADLTEKLKESSERHALSASVIRDVSQVLSECEKNVQECLPITTESFRMLRNACAGCEGNQNAVREYGIIQRTAQIISICCQTRSQVKSSTENEVWMQCIRCGVQALGNAAVNCQQNQNIIWMSLQPSLLLSLLQLNDVKVTMYASMVVHSCLSPEVLQFLSSTPEGIDSTASIVRHLAQHDSQWGLFILERLLESSHSIMPVYSHLEDKERLVILEVMEQKLSSYDSEKSVPVVGGVNLTDMAEDFKKKAHVILGLSHSEDIVEASVVAKQLSVLCALTAHPKLCAEVQSDHSLIECTVNLLYSIQLIGEKGQNAFSALPKASDQVSVDSQHPVFGLKKDLIRLLANLAYQNTENQNKIRDLGGIQVIMNHTNIDARNPFMMQWAIFAIHNLCENNPQNQAVISGIKLEGVADNVELLKEFGVQAEMDGDKIVVKQMDQTKSPFIKDKTDKARDL